MRRGRLLLLLLALAVSAVLVVWLWPRSPAERRRDTTQAAGPSRLRTAPQRLPAIEVQRPPEAKAAPRPVVRGAWGSAPGQFGRLPAQESNPEGPMSLGFDRSGAIVVLDQVNRRLQRFGKDGRLLGTQPIGSETAQDLLVDGQGRAHVLTRLGDAAGLQSFAPDGSPAGTVPVVGGKVKEGGAISGLFADADGLYVETEHDDLVRVADASGKATSLDETIPGRPSRDGKLYLRAGIISKPQGRLYVQAHDRDRKLAWERPLTFAAALLHILLLDSDLAGNVYLGAEIGDEDPATHKLQNVATVIARLDGQGKLTGSIALPPTGEDPTESFRPLAVSDEGVIYQLTSGPAGLTVTAYSF